MMLRSYEQTIALLEQQRAALRRSLLSLLYLRGKLEAELRRTGQGRSELDDVRTRTRWITERLIRCAQQIDDLRAGRVLAHARHTLAELDDGDERVLVAEAEHETEMLLAR